MNISLVQLETCKTCGLPYGSPDPDSARSRSYCERCSNLPQNVMAVLESHDLQMRQKEEEVREKEAAAEVADGQTIADGQTAADGS